LASVSSCVVPVLPLATPLVYMIDAFSQLLM
jgi:hypothetical protein